MENPATLTTPTQQPCIVPSSRRVEAAHEAFGLAFSLKVEPTIYAFAGQLCESYSGGYWEFATVPGGPGKPDVFYMYPAGAPETYRATSPNGSAHELTAEAFGITCCLFAYSHLSFSAAEPLRYLLIEAFHGLRDYVLDSEHPEAGLIFSLID